jgi:hypothetical protein
MTMRIIIFNDSVNDTAVLVAIVPIRSTAQHSTVQCSAVQYGTVQ